MQTQSEKNRDTRIGIFAAQQILAKYKNKSKYSRAHQFRLKSKLSDQCAGALQFVDFCGLEAETLTVKHKISGEVETLNLNHNKGSTEHINKILFVKDKFGISDQAYQSLA